jgi:hypothetical protein
MNLLLKESFDIPKNLLILDRNAFSSMVKDIDYFYRRRLLTEDDRENLKEEILDLLTFIEDIAATGLLRSKTEMSIYLSDVALESSYIHFETDIFESSLQYTYFVDTLSFNNPVVCQTQKKWIESLKRYSTLITQTGEMQCMDFFNEQREIVNKILS